MICLSCTCTFEITYPTGQPNINYCPFCGNSNIRNEDDFNEQCKQTN